MRSPLRFKNLELILGWYGTCTRGACEQKDTLAQFQIRLVSVLSVKQLKSAEVTNKDMSTIGVIAEFCDVRRAGATGPGVWPAFLGKQCKPALACAFLIFPLLALAGCGRGNAAFILPDSVVLVAASRDVLKWPRCSRRPMGRPGAKAAVSSSLEASSRSPHRLEKPPAPQTPLRFLQAQALIGCH